jgi:hypothetical protein
MNCLNAVELSVLVVLLSKGSERGRRRPKDDDEELERKDDDQPFFFWGGGGPRLVSSFMSWTFFYPKSSWTNDTHSPPSHIDYKIRHQVSSIVVRCKYVRDMLNLKYGIMVNTWHEGAHAFAFLSQLST